MDKDKILPHRSNENKLQLKKECRKLEVKLMKRLKNRRNILESNRKIVCQQRKEWGKRLLKFEHISSIYCVGKNHLKSQSRKLSYRQERTEEDVVIISSDESVYPVLNFYQKETLQQNFICSGYNLDNVHHCNDNRKQLEIAKSPLIPSINDVFDEIEQPKNTSLYYGAIQGCRNVDEFQFLKRIDEGSYGIVYQACDKGTGELIALKRIKMKKEKDGFPITSLREINILLRTQHPNIVKLREIVFGCDLDEIFIVMDYIEYDLKSLIEKMKFKKKVFNTCHVKCLIEQLLHAVAYLHDNWILHRDLKTSNVLLSCKGILKVGDFGSAREYGCPVKPYTPVVVTLWYRAPELLLSAKEYSTPVDMWSVGCIFAELLLMEPLFPGNSVINQLKCIFNILGRPNENTWSSILELSNVQRVIFPKYQLSWLQNSFIPAITTTGLDLLNEFLIYDPAKRITAENAVDHGYFSELPHAADQVEFSNWLSKLEWEHHEVNNYSPTGFGINADEGFHMVIDSDCEGFRLKF